MPKLNLLNASKKPIELIDAFIVRTCASKSDPYKGLYGQAYIEARGLKQPVNRVQTSALLGA